MDKSKRSEYDKDAQSYLDKVSDRYIFDRTGGIYKQKSHDDAEKRCTDTTGRFKRFPFWVNVKRDWVAFVLSGLTLILLAYTVRYTRRQWIAMSDKFPRCAEQMN